ncbi:MAG: hypothetical protein M1819_004192 [Sarea resinae]|nr:MAG: hypothetical protein M1819_004192 [Sarea resinae]
MALLAASLTGAAVADFPVEKRNSTADDRLVFAHFMIDIVSDRTSPSDYDTDMTLAQSVGIDAFALNIGTESFSDTQLYLAYASALSSNMKVFLSFDFASKTNNSWSTGQAAEIGAKIAQFAWLPAQLLIDDKPFVSTHGGDGLDVGLLRLFAGREIFFAPNFDPKKGTDFGLVDGALNWNAWPNNGNGGPPTADANFTVEDGDQTYLAALGSRAYIAPVSPWFFTHMSASQNYILPSDTLWYDRWTELLNLGPRFVEILTWNDYRDSSYVGPLAGKHTDDGSSKWVNDMTHLPLLHISTPFISAYHSSLTTPSVPTTDSITYMYRRVPRLIPCPTTDTIDAPPTGYLQLADSIFAITALASPGTLNIQTGSLTIDFPVPAGFALHAIDFGLGSQYVALKRDGAIVLQATGAWQIQFVCVCGVYDFNVFSGSVPAVPLEVTGLVVPDQLAADGLAEFEAGLKVTTCLAEPSLTVAAGASEAVATPTA